MVKWKTYRKGLDHKNLWEITYIVQIKKTKHKKKKKTVLAKMMSSFKGENMHTQCVWG